MKLSRVAEILRHMAEASRQFMEAEPTLVDSQQTMQEQQIACDIAAEKLENLVRKAQKKGKEL